MTTIQLTAEQEEVIRRWQGANSSRLTDELRLIAQLADALPPPPYVPAVGDTFHAYTVNDEEHRSAGEQVTWQGREEGERCLAVLGIDGGDCVVSVIPCYGADARPEVYAYRIDAHRFEKVEQ